MNKPIIINHLEFGEIIINNQKFHDVLIYDNKIEQRDYPKLEEVFGTGHFIGEWEKIKLLSGEPEIIIIGNGYQGVLKVDEDFKNEIKKRNIELIINYTPDVIDLINNKIKEGKRINALIHTTC